MDNTDNNHNHSPQQQREPTETMQEMGYLLLRDTPIQVVQSQTHDGTHATTNHSHPTAASTTTSWRRHTWMPVELQDEGCSDDARMASPSATRGDGCPRCHLVLERQTTKDPSATMNHNTALQLDWTRVHPFSGTLTDTNGLDGDRGNMEVATAGSSSYDPHGCHCRGKRSDAALLMGLLKQCRDHVRVVTASVLWSKDETTTTASLVVTLAFPHLHQATHHRSLLPGSAPHHRKKTKAAPTKALYPALQLLLAIVRSDWSELDRTMQHLETEGVSSATESTFFPSQATLPEIYKRLRASGKTDDTVKTVSVVSTGCRNGNDKDSLSIGLLGMPADVLIERVAPFLDSRSLGSLRTANSFLYKLLRGVVPGLNLNLYRHQVNSLVWMRRRESSLIRNEKDCFEAGDAFDVHRSVTGGASVKLVSKPPESVTSEHSSSCWHIRINAESGHEMNECDGNRLPRQVARGGLLCDDPGLGKTVTVLALILQTFGCKTSRPVPSDDCLDNEESLQTTSLDKNDAIFQAYWSEQVVPEFRGPALLKLLNQFAKQHQGAAFFPGLLKEALSKDTYESNFAAFEGAVRNLIKEHDPALEPAFEGIVHEFKMSQMKSARKSFSNAKSKPNSQVAALIEKEARSRLLNSLIPSACTLLVIPAVLMEHWKTQLKLHVNFSYCTNRIPLIFEYQKKNTSMTVDKAIILCRLNKTHAPLVFLDKAGTRPLPPASFLSMFSIVITTNHRFMNEWKKGSLESELDRNGETSSQTLSSDLNAERTEACELLKVNWVRMVVDEGHSMGHDRANSTIQFASWINAQRRWAMTGTPTKQSSVQVGQLRGLMRYLQHEFFTSRLHGDLFWKRSIAKSWRDGALVAFFRLRLILGYLMKRHTKLDIAELSPPVYTKTGVSMSFVEATTYNTLVCSVQANLLLTSMKGKTSGLQDSLLHKSQAKNARLALQNIRRVCTGWSRVVPTLEEKLYRETISMAENFGLSEGALANIKDFVHRAENEQLSQCSCCCIELSTLVLMPCCGGMICTECMDNTTPQCFLCDTVFDIDKLQQFQPGFVLEWKSNLELQMEKLVSRMETKNEQRVTSESNSAGAITDARASDPVEPLADQLLRPPRDNRRKNKVGDGHTCEYDRYAGDGKCILCWEEHNFCNLLNSGSRCDHCFRVAERCTHEESKSFYLSGRLLSLYESQPSSVRSESQVMNVSNKRPLKVIVFSQFRAALNVVGDRLLRRFGTACIAEYFGRHRKEELQKFTHNVSCFCLLLTKDGAEGLDLSFVTNIIFLEEILDLSLKEQAVARAWRMGAKGAVHVETLIASNTVEETLTALNNATNTKEHSETEMLPRVVDQKRTKLLLESLRLTTDYHNCFATTAKPEETGATSKAMSTTTKKRSLLFSESTETEPIAKKRKACVSFAVVS